MAYDFSNITVLIIDDMEPVVKLLEKTMRFLGFRNIDIAYNGTDGFDLFCQKNHDLVLTDWAMPGLNGIELTKKIRTSPLSPNNFVPIIFVSGFCTQSHVTKARDAGANEFLVKPFTATDLYERIEQLIERPRDFVKTPVFFGPDRRRKLDVNFKGERKRKIDEIKTMETTPNDLEHFDGLSLIRHDVSNLLKP